MAKNITLMGASYSDVPAVNLPQTGGGTARFDDCSVTTATASDVAQGKIFVASDGTVTTGTASGGGGGDAPTFTVVWTDDYSSVVSLTCDKSFEECDDILESVGFALVVDNIQSGTAEMLGTATATGGDDSSLRYTVYFGGVYPAYDIVYYSNGTISAVSPSQMVETLNATTNGTYYPQGGIITEVNVNVPQPSGTKNISISANGTTTEDVTNYANAQITVAVPQPSGSINITQNGTVDVTNYASAVVNVSGGGGASNFVTGKFTGTTAQKGTAININLPYTGSGYPVSIVVYPSDGPYNSNSTFYNLIQRYACCFLVGIKSSPNTRPLYSGGADSMMAGYQYRKNSTSNATTYTGTVTTGNIVFSNSQAATSNSLGIVNFSSATQMSVFIANTSYGFAAGIEYTYQVAYSG